MVLGGDCMGVFDTLVDGDESVQVKCFASNLRTFHVGDIIIDSPYDDMTIVCPDYSDYSGESKIFALLKDGKFFKLTRDPEETYPPYVDKWGGYLSSAEDFKNHFRILVEEIARTVERESQ